MGQRTLKCVVLMATAPPRAEARTAIDAALALTGNASSVHAEGRSVRRLVEEAREKVAHLVGADTKNVVLTSGATKQTYSR